MQQSAVSNQRSAVGGRRSTIERQQLLTISILVLAAALRFYLLDAQSFWNDEGNSARLSERSLRLIIEGTASDVHPPLYYLLLRGLRELIGASEFALRSLSAFAGVLTVAATIALGRSLGGRRVSLIAGLITAVSPPLIYYSQEARMYSLLAFLASLSTLFIVYWLLQIRNYPSIKSRQTNFRFTKGLDHHNNFLLTSPALHSTLYTLPYILTAAAGLYTHYFFPAILAAHGLIVTYFLVQKWRERTPLKQVLRRAAVFAAMLAAALLIYAPWLPIFWRNTGGGTSSPVSLSFYFAQAAEWLLVGPTLEAAVWTLSLTGVLVVASLAHRQALVPLIWLLIPTALMFVVGATTSQFLKFLTAVVPALALLITFPLVELSRNRWLQYLPFLLALPYAALFLASLSNLYSDPAYARADYRGMAAQITAEAHPNAAVLLNAPNQWEVFTYYYQGDAPIYPVGESQPTPEEVAADLAQITVENNRLYALFWGEHLRDPERLYESWLDTHTFKAVDEWRGDVRFVIYAIPEAAADSPSTQTELRFGDAIMLDGYALSRERYAPGDILQITLFWRALRPIEERYKVFLHLIAADGSLVAQRDTEPGGNLAPTTTWAVDAAVVDNHGVLLPADLPAGEYTLKVGLYDLSDPNERLPIQTAAGTVDTWQVATIIVE